MLALRAGNPVGVGLGVLLEHGQHLLIVLIEGLH